jgi:molybdenum cofactor cytidylyltransferase
VPLRDGVRGNPIVLPAWARRDIDAEPINFGCRNLIARHPESVLAFRSTDSAYFEDVDTPKSYWDLTATLLTNSNDCRPKQLA